MEVGISQEPVVAVLHDPEDPPPDMERLVPGAEIRRATDVGTLEQVLTAADVLLVTDFRSGALEAAWPAARRLQWVHATSAGVDALLFPALVESDIPLTNARGIFNAAIAEHVLGIMLAFAKDIPGSVRLQDEHRWRHRDTERLAGQRLLVVGAGSIGRTVAKLARAAGLKVSGIARNARREDPDFDVVHGQNQLVDALPEADFIVVAAPLTDETHHLFDASAFAAMHSRARLINVGRGPIIDTDALVTALYEDQIAGAALDVFEQEPLPDDHPLWDFRQVLVTAHMAGDFLGWRRALVEQFAENFRRWRTGEPLFNRVDKRRGYGRAA